MRPTEIQADNVLAIKSINLKLERPNTLICGRNGTLKSSIFDVMSMALAHTPMRAVTEKQHYGLLVHDGAKAGGGMVVIDGDAENARQFNLPKGEFTGPEIPAAMRVALNGQNFASMTADERRVFLCTLTKVRPTPAIVEPLLLAVGPQEPAQAAKFKPLVDEVMPMLRSGFQAACDYAKEQAAGHKRDWCKTTGAKTYGAKIAEAWSAPVPDVPNGDIEDMKRIQAEIDARIATLNQSIGSIKQATDQALADVAARMKLAMEAGKMESLQEQIETMSKELAAYEPKVVALRERAKGVARVGLVHEQARFIAGLVATDAAVAVVQAKLVAAYHKEHGALGNGEPDAEAQMALPDHEKGLTVLQNRLANLKRDLATATAAKAQYDVLAPAAEAVDSTAELDEINGLLAQAKQEKQDITNKILDIQAAIRNRAEAIQKNEAAAIQHGLVGMWLTIAEQLAPSGIPMQLLKKALEPVNKVLHQASVDTEWPRTIINEDMSITCGGRLYQLQSESFQWRANAMIAEMVAEISGLKFVMLDRVDMLDVVGRGELLGWLDMLVDVGAIDGSMSFATLNKLPEPGALPASFESFWVEDGTIAASSASPVLEAV